MAIMANRMRHICNIPLRWLDSFRLHRDSLLSQGGIRTVGIVFFFGLFVTFLVALGLFFYYGNYFFLNAISTPDYAQGSFKPKNIIDAAYYLLITNGGQNFFEGAHLWGAVITSVGIILIAFLTSTLTSLMERRAERYLCGESRYRMKNHIVVFGASDYLYSIIREKTRDKENGSGLGSGFRRQRFLIVTNKDVKAVRREVFSFLETGIRKKDFVFLFGERTSPEDISHLSLEYAKEVFIIGDSEESDDYESYRDANNMDCVKAIGEYLDRVAYSDVEIVKDGVVSPKTPKALRCHVMFEYQTSFAAFQFSKPKLSARLDFRPFNYYDLWARKMLASKGEGVYSHQYLDTIEPDKKYIDKNSEKTVHLIILGMSKMGLAMGIQAAHICHYPNFSSSGDDKTKLKRTRITFIDANADVEMNYLKGRFPGMMSDTRVRYIDFSEKSIFIGGWKGDEKGWYDIEWEFIKGRIESPAIQDYIERAAGNNSKIVTIASCLPKSHQSMAAAMYMRESVYANVLQIFTFQRYSGTIVNDLAGAEAGRYQKTVPFGMMECGYDSSLDDDTRAMLVSYVYASYYALNPSTLKMEAKTDPGFKRFESFTDWPMGPEKYWVYPDYSYKWPKEKLFEKLSSAYNASTISTKLRGIGILNEDDCMSLTEEQVDILKRVEHNRWNLEKMLTGYRALNKEEAALMADLWNDANNTNLNQAKIDQRKKEWEELTKKKWEENHKEDFPVMALWEKQRGVLKGWPLRAHLDLCSIEELYRRETEDTINMDKYLSEAIPNILRIEKEFKKNHKRN